MTDLTNPQRELLTLAADAEDGLTVAPAMPKPTIAALIKRGFLISLPQSDGPSQLLITQAGKAAIGRAGEPAEAPAPPDSLATEAPAPDIPSEPTAAAPASTPLPKGKLGRVIELLRRSQGASVEEMMGATGWQPHSVRGAMSGALKKKLGLTILSQKTDAGRTYRIPADPEREVVAAMVETAVPESATNKAEA